MWIVRNTTRGRLRFPGLALSIGPGAETDLDLLGRRRAETSNQILVAFEEGYLETVRKDGGYPTVLLGGERGGEREGVVTDALLAERLEAFKRSLTEELEAMRSQLSGDMQAIAGGIEGVHERLARERRRILNDRSLSESEIEARLQFLAEQEQRLERNFEAIGRQVERGTEDEGGGIDEKARLLSRL